MRADLDSGLVNKIKGLKLELTDKPQPELLISLPNRNPTVRYSVECTTEEFTSLCPLASGQPDYACISINYVPDKKVVELKSLKFFLVSFRNVEVFHEEVPSIILTALVKLLQPKSIVVGGIFTTRGGIDTTVTASYTRPINVL